jgi:serine/threonine protein kinase
MVMEYCKDHDLFDYITGGALANEPNLVGAAKSVFHQLCDAIHFMHGNRVYHRDLKPENIMLTRDAQGRPSIRVGDFGLATDDRFNADRGCGSDFYMAPESRRVSSDTERELERKLGYQRFAYDPEKADVWALGILLCNLACGRNPWNQASLTDAGFMHYLRSPRTALMDLLPVTEQLNNVLMRALAINPDHRPTVAELYKMVMSIRGRFRRVGVPFGAVKAEPGYIDTDMDCCSTTSKSSSDVSDDDYPRTPDSVNKQVSQWSTPATPTAQHVAAADADKPTSATRLNQLLGLVA